VALAVIHPSKDGKAGRRFPPKPPARMPE
jgi:hypothetical protein